LPGGGRIGSGGPFRRWSEGSGRPLRPWRRACYDCAAVCRVAAGRAAVPLGVLQRWRVGWGGRRVIDDIGHVPRCPDAAGHGATAGRATKGDHHEAAQACTCVDLSGRALRRGCAASQRMHDAVDRAGPVTCGVPFSGLSARRGKPVTYLTVTHRSSCSRAHKEVRHRSAPPGGAYGLGVQR